MNVIEVRELRKSYGKVKAVKGISFDVKRGSLFAFLGPNGAGKSTTIDILCTFLTPDSGTVCLDGLTPGKDNAAIRREIGVVFQEGLLDPRLTVRDNLRIRGGFYGLSGSALSMALSRAAQVTGTTDFLDRPYGKLSGGQRRRADIARALIHTPKILFLDEPTTGLDPQTRQTVWQTVASLCRETDMTVFLTTHYMEEAEATDHVVILDNGLIAAEGTPADLRRRYAADRLTLFCADEDKLIRLLMTKGLSFTREADKYFLTLGSTMEALPLVNEAAPFITGFEVTEGTMDDAFIGITGKEIRE